MGLALPGTRRRRDGACAAQAFCQRQNLGLGQFSCPKRDGNRVPAKGPAFCGAGQNARLAAKLTGWKIDIKPVSAPADEEPEDEADVLLDDEAETEE